MIKYIIIKKWTKVNDEWYSKDIQFNNFVELGDYLMKNHLYKVELRVIYEKSSDTEVTCIK